MYEGRASSPLALPGGCDVCVELFSFAKSHHLAGFRLGFALVSVRWSLTEHNTRLDRARSNAGHTTKECLPGNITRATP